MKVGSTLEKIEAEIHRRVDAKRDLIVPVTKMHFDFATVEVPNSEPAHRIYMAVGNEQFAIQQHAHQQLIEFTKIPGDYYKKLMAEDPELLVTNLNRRVPRVPEKRRMVRLLDNKVRAVLSDGYRRFDNEDFAAAIVPLLKTMDLQVLSAELTDSRLYFKAVDQAIAVDVPTGVAMGDGGHTIFDTICPALSIANSEIGMGAVVVETGTYTKACTNLALFGPTNGGIRRNHAGARAELSDDVYALLTDETKQLTDAAVWAQIRDVIKGAWSEERIRARAAKLGETTKDKIEDVEEAVVTLAKTYTLSQDERKGIMHQLIRGGDLTRYGMHSAVTRFSQDVENYDRATFLEQLGSKIIDLPKKDWSAINRKAA